MHAPQFRLLFGPATWESGDLQKHQAAAERTETNQGFVFLPVAPPIPVWLYLCSYCCLPQMNANRHLNSTQFLQLVPVACTQSFSDRAVKKARRSSLQGQFELGSSANQAKLKIEGKLTELHAEFELFTSTHNTIKFPTYYFLPASSTFLSQPPPSRSPSHMLLSLSH